MQQRFWLIGAVFGLLLTLAWWQRPDGRMHVFLLPVAGDALLIQAPNGRFTLIDGGRDPIGLAVEVGQRMPFWQRQLAAVVLTRVDDQRLPGQVGVLRRYRAHMALAPTLVEGEWRDLTRDQATVVRQLRAGQQIDLGGARLRVLAVSDGKEGGAVLLIEHQAVRVLIHTGGSAGDGALSALGGQRIDLLIYPWQRPVGLPALSALRVGAVAFSRGYEAAAPELASFHERRRLAPRLYHPKIDGTIHLTSDGRRAVISAQTQ